MTIAEYGEKYKAYLFGGTRPKRRSLWGSESPLREKDGKAKGNKPVVTFVKAGPPSLAVTEWQDNGFLNMGCWGPYDTGNTFHMFYLVRNLLVMTIKLGRVQGSSRALFRELEPIF